MREPDHGLIFPDKIASVQPWDRLFETFARPWKIIHHKGGSYYIEDKRGRVICWVYLKGTDTANHKNPTEEALMIVRAIAKMSKRKT